MVAFVILHILFYACKTILRKLQQGWHSNPDLCGSEVCRCTFLVYYIDGKALLSRARLGLKLMSCGAEGLGKISEDTDSVARNRKEYAQSLNTSVLKDHWLVMVMDGIHRTSRNIEHGALSHNRCLHICTYSVITARIKVCHTKKIRASQGKLPEKLGVYIL